MATLYEKVQSLSQKIEANNIWRQRESFNLIPSEATPSLLVKMCEISDPSGRYAEHKTMKGQEVYFYQGIDFIKEIEDQAKEGVDFMTVHAGLTSKAIERLKNQGRVADVVSRGGAFHLGWILHNEKENPLYSSFDSFSFLGFDD